MIDFLICFIAFISVVNFVFILAISGALTKILSPRKRDDLLISRVRRFNTDGRTPDYGDNINSALKKNWGEMAPDNE